MVLQVCRHVFELSPGRTLNNYMRLSVIFSMGSACIRSLQCGEWRAATLKCGGTDRAVKPLKYWIWKKIQNGEKSVEKIGPTFGFVAAKISVRCGVIASIMARNEAFSLLALSSQSSELGSSYGCQISGKSSLSEVQQEFE